MRRFFILSLFALAFGSVVAQQNPKENAEVLVGVRYAAKNLATSDQFSVELWLAGESDIISSTYNGAGTSSIAYSAGLHALMKPNRHYQARITPTGSWSGGQVKFSAPAGYKIWINDLPTSVGDADGVGLVFKIELRPDNDASALPAGEAVAPRVSPLIWQISAGRYSNGLPAGSVQWRAADLSADLLDPTSLTYTEPASPEVALTRHSDGAVLELRTFQFLLYIRRNATAGTGYDVEIYDPYVTRTGSGDGPYTYDAGPYRVYRVSNPNGSTWGDRIKIEKIDDSNTESWDISQSGTDWTVIESNSLRTTVRQSSTVSGNREEIIKVQDNASPTPNVATKLKRVYQTKAWGEEELISETINPDATDGTALTTGYDYYTTYGTGGYGRLKSVSNPDGSWVRYDYDDSGAGFGNLVAVLRPWQDNSSSITISTATTSNCNATILSYSGEGPAFNDLPAGVERKVGSTTVAKNTVGYSFSSVAGNGQPLRTDTTTSYTGASSTLVSTRKVYNPSSASIDYNGRLYSQVAVDGAMVSTLRYKGQLQDFGDGGLWVKKSSTTANNVVWVEYHFNGFSSAVQDAVAVSSFDSETMDTVYMVPNRSTVDISIYDDEGRVRYQVPCVFTGASGGVPSFENTGRDEFYFENGIPSLQTKLNGWSHQQLFLNNMPVWDISNEGITTWIDRNPSGRINNTQKTAVTVSGEYVPQGSYANYYGYDAADRIISERVTSDVSNGATTDSVTTTRVYNLGGLLTSETAESGGGNFTTSYGYTNGGRTVTMTLPGPGSPTKVTDRYIDGSPKSATGTAVVAQYYSTTVNTDGTITRQTTIASATGARLSKVTTDWAGRTIKEERPAPPGASPSTFTKQYYYNSNGQLYKTTETALADTLISYNAWQQPYQTGLDLNANGSLDIGGTDRITETDTVFEKDSNNAWWTKTTTKAYNVDSNPTPVTTGIVKTRLNKFTRTGGNDLQAESVSTDVFGNQTSHTVAVQRGSSYFETDLRLVTETITYPDSSTAEVTVTRNGLLQKHQTKEGLVSRTYYDGRGRPVKTTDPRTDTSTTPRLGYVNNSDRIAWRQDTAGNQTSYTYESDTGRLATTTDPLSKVERYSYTTRGEVYRTWGDTSYPVEYAYDDYGQRVTMKTYRGGAGWTGTSWPSSSGTADTTTWAFDNASGTLTSKTDAAAIPKTVAYTYNTRGQLKSRTWARLVGGSPLTTTYSYFGDGSGLSGEPVTAELRKVDYSDSTPDLQYTYNRLGQTQTVLDATSTSGTDFRTFNYSSTTAVMQSEDLPSFFGSRRITYPRATSGVVGRAVGLQLGTSGSPSAEQAVTYDYDVYGRFDVLANGTTTLGYAYTANSNLLGAIADGVSGWTQTRTFLPGRDLLDIIETKYGATTKSKFEYDHDSLGRRTSVTKTGELYARYGTSGLVTGWSYNDRSEVTGEVTNVTVGSTSAALAGRSDGYAYDNIGNRSSTTHNATSSSYASNALNQYTQRAVAGSVDVTGLAPSAATVTINGSTTGITQQNDWFYKSVSIPNTSAAVWQSIVSSSSLGGSATRTAFVPMTPEVLGYDDDGNMIADGRWDYVYDAENRLKSMQTHGYDAGTYPINNSDARRIEFRYDYLGRRVQKTVLGWSGSGFSTVISDEKFVYDGWNAIAKLNASSNALAASYYWGLDWSGTLQGAGGVGGLALVVDSGNTYLPMFDGNGNVMGLIKASNGSMDAAYEYDAFGRTLRQSGTYAASNAFRYSSKYTDNESDLVYYGLRYYSPSLGRFINKDPIEEKGGLNLYGFCSNNGVNHWDYLGNVVIRTDDMLRGPGNGGIMFSGGTNITTTTGQEGQGLIPSSTGAKTHMSNPGSVGSGAAGSIGDVLVNVKENDGSITQYRVPLGSIDPSTKISFSVPGVYAGPILETTSYLINHPSELVPPAQNFVAQANPTIPSDWNRSSGPSTQAISDAAWMAVATSLMVGTMAPPGEADIEGEILQGAMVAEKSLLQTESAAAPKGGVYVLRDAEGDVMRSGRSNDLISRAADHARDAVLKDFTFEAVYKTDVYDEQRGLEQVLHDTYNPPLNKIRPISPDNPNRQKYMDAAKNFLDDK